MLVVDIATEVARTNRQQRGSGVVGFLRSGGGGDGGGSHMQLHGEANNEVQQCGGEREGRGVRSRPRQVLHQLSIEVVPSQVP